MDKALSITSLKSNAVSSTHIMKGLMAMVGVLFIWSGFALTVRAIEASPLHIADVMLIRFFIPMVLLTPWLFYRWEEIKKTSMVDFLCILLGGVPFILFASLGAQTAPTAYVGLILAGTPPLFVAGFSLCFLRQTISAKKLLSLFFIMAGVMVMMAGNASGFSKELMHGIGYLLLASLSWAGFTIGIKRNSLSPMAIATVLSYASFFIVLGSILFGGIKVNIGSVAVEELIPFFLVQGLCVGVLAVVGFSYAVNQLGSIRTSLVGSISPCLTALFAVFIFRETLSTLMVLGMVFSMAGVVLSNRS